MDDQTDISTLLTLNASLNPGEGLERWLTGYSDASFKDRDPNKGGGWGCWVRDSKTRCLRSGPCPEWVSNSQDAELCGVFSAVHTALTVLDAGWANILVIKTDNQGVARWFGWRGSSTVPQGSEQVDLVRRALQQANSHHVRLVVTWVKGHRGDMRDTSAFLNTQVDKMAHEARLTRQPTKQVMSVYTKVN